MSGMDGLIAGDTELSSVDGAAGQLLLRGHRIEELAGRVTFEEVVAVLRGTRADLAAGRRWAWEWRQRWSPALEASDPMDALRGGLSLLHPDESAATEVDDAVGIATTDMGAAGDADARVIGAAAVIASAWDRRRRGLEAVAPGWPPEPPPGFGSVASSGPRPARAQSATHGDRAAPSHAADLLHMLDGAPPSPARAAALDAYLVAVIDHGFNASTFTARVVASTGSDALSCVVAAVGALKGPLHGGAPGPVLDMLDAVAARTGEGEEDADDGATTLDDAARSWVADELAAGRRIMGIGHRVYRVRDPRAAALERALQRLERAEPSQRAGRIAVARAVEHAAVAALAARHPTRPMHANVEFATALLLDALGIDRVLFPAVFACSRVAGWLAHVGEQRRTGRLIRPKARYVGPRP